MGLGQRRVALDIELGKTELRLRLAELAAGLSKLSLRLIERGLKRPGIDLEEDVSFADVGSLRDNSGESDTR